MFASSEQCLTVAWSYVLLVRLFSLSAERVASCLVILLVGYT